MANKKDMMIGDLFRLEPLHVADTKRFDEYIKLHGLPPINALSVVDPKTLIGIEVEIENVLKMDPNLLLGFWEQRPDGSLRDHGVEFVTPPMPAAYAYAAITSLFKYLNDSIKFTKRTSVHVHMNVRNMTYDQLFNVLYLYHIVEPLLFKFVGGERDRNIFCVPWTNSDTFQEATSLPLKEALKNFSEQSHKYTALNLVPIKKFGTLEFRHLPGMSDIRKIVTWINLILSLKIYALRGTTETLIQAITNLNTNSAYQKFVEDIFGQHAAVLDMSELQRDLEGQVTNIKDCVVVSGFHKTIVSTQNEDSSALNDAILRFLKQEGKPANKDKSATVIRTGRAEGGRGGPPRVRDFVVDAQAIAAVGDRGIGLAAALAELMGNAAPVGAPDVPQGGNITRPDGIPVAAPVPLDVFDRNNENVHNNWGFFADQGPGGGRG